MIDAFRTSTLRFVAIGFFSLLAACAQGGGGKPGPTPPTQQGGATYVPLTRADDADAPGAQAAANRTFTPPKTNSKNQSGDKRPIETFQYYFVNAVQAAKPKRMVVGGKGASLGTAFVLKDIVDRLELQGAMNDLLARYPDRHDVSGELMRGTNDKYVLHVTFLAGGTPRELFYDVTHWVISVRRG